MSDVTADFVRALDLHKERIRRLQEALCECPHRELFQADLHDETCPVYTVANGPVATDAVDERARETDAPEHPGVAPGDGSVPTHPPAVSLQDRLQLDGLRREHLRVSALLTAVLLKTGPITLSKAEAEAIHRDPQLHYEATEDGGLTLRVEA